MQYDILKKVALFSALDEKALEAIAQHAVNRTYPKNSVVINEGDNSDSLYIILSGKVKAYLSDENGKEIIIGIQQPGDYFGELALIDEEPRAASIMTLEKSSFSVISKSSFHQYLLGHPDVALMLLRDLARRLRSDTGIVKSLALMDVYGRLAKTLIDLSNETEDGKLVIEQKLTHQDLANMVGSSREMVSRILKDLSTGGYISVDHKVITINEKLPSAW